MEMLFPLYSLLKDSHFRVPDVNIVLLHLKRWHLMEWVRAVMATTFAVGTDEALPPILLQDETDITFEQPTMALEGVPADTWVRRLNARPISCGGCMPPTTPSAGLRERFRYTVQLLCSRCAALKGSFARAVQIAFERVMIVRDLFTGGKRSFASTADARDFREHIYHNHGLALPVTPSPRAYLPPRVWPAYSEKLRCRCAV